jgi:multimeric flavodoxin WrbA
MKVLCLGGSSRNRSNSSILAKVFCDTAEGLGASVQNYSLKDLKYSGCTGCEICKTKLDRCALDDDLSKVLDAVYETDVLVLASPVYYGDISSQLKAFVDRTYAFLLPDYLTNPVHSRLPPGKKLVFILAQANAEKTRYADIYPRYEHFFNWYYGFEDNHLIRACGVRNPGDVEAQQEIIKFTENVAKRAIASAVAGTKKLW